MVIPSNEQYTFFFFQYQSQYILDSKWVFFSFRKDLSIRTSYKTPFVLCVHSFLHAPDIILTWIELCSLLSLARKIVVFIFATQT